MLPGWLSSVKCNLLHEACRVLPAACCMVSVACCLWHVVRCMLHGVRCMLSVAWCPLHVVCGMLHVVACCMLSVCIPPVWLSAAQPLVPQPADRRGSRDKAAARARPSPRAAEPADSLGCGRFDSDFGAGGGQPHAAAFVGDMDENEWGRCVCSGCVGFRRRSCGSCRSPSATASCSCWHGRQRSAGFCRSSGTVGGRFAGAPMLTADES